MIAMMKKHRKSRSEHIFENSFFIKGGGGVDINISFCDLVFSSIEDGFLDFSTFSTRGRHVGNLTSSNFYYQLT